MRLLHVTNYEGKKIKPSKSKRDNDTDLDLIWVQAVPGNEDACCPGFGDRIINISERVFRHWDPDNWVLWYVAGNWGHIEDHYFHKFVFIPKGYPDLGYKSLINKGWGKVYEMDPGHTFFEGMADALDTYWFDDTDDVNHVHIGIFTADQPYYVN